jgi:hypothetical protein
VENVFVNNGHGFNTSSNDEAMEIWNLLGAAHGGDGQVPIASYSAALTGRIKNRYDIAFGDMQIEKDRFVTAVKAEINRIYDEKWEDLNLSESPF